MRPDYILYVQHGWADTNLAIASLAYALVSPAAHVVVPSLGYVKTWIAMEPLIQQTERYAQNVLNRYPFVPLRIIGHSMGGLIWVETLMRHPDWWSRVHSLVLIGSPVGGSHLARMIDPLGIGIGIACDLGINRRAMAERIAAVVPTLVIASDVWNGFDGTVATESTKLAGATIVSLPGLIHKATRNHPYIVKIIRDFWHAPTCAPPPPLDLATRLIRRIQAIPSMTDTHRWYFQHAIPHLSFTDGTTIRLWSSPLRTLFVFVVSASEQCLYSGSVGWLHRHLVSEALAGIRRDEQSSIRTQ